MVIINLFIRQVKSDKLSVVGVSTHLLSVRMRVNSVGQHLFLMIHFAVLLEEDL